jgi:hypothetical protein
MGILGLPASGRCRTSREPTSSAVGPAERSAGAPGTVVKRMRRSAGMDMRGRQGQSAGLAPQPQEAIFWQ